MDTPKFVSPEYASTVLPYNFWRKVKVLEGGCWEWTGLIRSNGYGVYSYSKADYAFTHRYAYEKTVEPIPTGLTIDHLCRNRKCVNPNHLEVVTIKVNNLRGTSPVAINARKTMCPRGHSLIDPANVGLRPNGGRNCRACKRLWQHNHLAERRAYRRRKKSGTGTLTLGALIQKLEAK